MPTEVRAWIVAIEKYAAGTGADDDELNIPAPVGAWALDLAELLLARGVLPANLALHVSLAGRPEYEEAIARLRGKGVEPRGATRNELEAAVQRLHGDGALIVYWVGHGIMDPETRYFLTAESQRRGELVAISATSLVKHFRSDDFPPFQMGFFDCCAQLVDTPTFLNLNPGKSPGAAQYFYFAASGGEYAAADTTRKGFSSTAIEEMRSSLEIPPQPDPFFPDLRRKLAQLDLATRPNLLEWTDGSGDQWSRAGSELQAALLDEARRAEMSWRQFEHLFQQAAKLGVSASDLSQAAAEKKIQDLIGALKTKFGAQAAITLLERAWDRVQLAAQFDKLAKALRLSWRDWQELASEVQRADYLGDATKVEELQGLLLAILDQDGVAAGWRSLLKLLLLAAQRAGRFNGKAADDLCEALRNHPSLGALYDQVVAQLPKPEQLYLLIGLQFDSKTKAISIGRAWLFRGNQQFGEPWDVASPDNQGTAAQMIQFEVERILGNYCKHPLVVELLAPHFLLCPSKEILSTPADPPFAPTWLESSYPVTVRWHNRMQGQTACQPGTWVQVSEQAREQARSGQLSCGWPADGKLPEFKKALIVGLPYPGPTTDEAGRNAGPFFEILKKGAPYMCWPRSRPTDPQMEQDFAKLVQQTCSIEELAAILQKKKEAGLFHDLVLFIDEPERNPYQQKLHQTRQQGGS